MTVEASKSRRVYLTLRERIASGTWSYGTRLPGEPALAVQQGVSRVTVRRALHRLAQEGLVQRRAGAGTFVAGGDLGPTVGADLADVYAHLRTMGQRTGVRLVSFAYCVPPAPVASALALAPGGLAQRAVRVRSIEGEPFSYLTTHVPERIGLTYAEADLAAGPLLALLERSGIVASRARQSITAALAGPEVAEALQLEVGAALLSLTRVVHDATGAAVEHLHALYRPDRFAFHLDLGRTGTSRSRRWTPCTPNPRS